jgi:pimeloyl-ACP methyl ester carboxylesterase
MDASDNTSIRQLWKKYKAFAHYFEGDSANPFVSDSQGIIDSVIEDILRHLKKHPEDKGKIDLFGWSRGAVLAATVAEELKKRHIDVRFLGLIDPVAAGIDVHIARRIAPNVRNVFIGYHDPEEGNGFLWIFTSLIMKLEDVENCNTWSRIYPGLDHMDTGWDDKLRDDMIKKAKEHGLKFNK